MEIITEIIKDCKKWQQYKRINKSLVKKITKAVMQHFSNLSQVAQFELSILLTDNEAMQELNSQFRNKKNPTNTLSFPDIEIDSVHLLEFRPNLDYMYLGDIAFSYQVIYDEAILQNKTFENHFIHLLIHSILHLIGFDHQNDESANIMEGLEVQFLKNLSIPSPYIN